MQAAIPTVASVLANSLQRTAQSASSNVSGFCYIFSMYNLAAVKEYKYLGLASNRKTLEVSRYLAFIEDYKTPACTGDW